jgi:hypothetical protein
MIYADPSFLCSLYGWDDLSAVAQSAYARDRRRPLLFTLWQRFECRNAIRLAIHRLRRASRTVPFQPGSVFKQMDEDIAAGTLRHADVDWGDSMRLAEDLSAKYTELTGCASVDVWHVAAARLLEADTFWTFDAEQQDLAKRTGYFRHAPKFH